MRRRSLLSSVATGSVALAGCSLPSSIGGSDGGLDVDSSKYLAFSEAIDETTRHRCLRSLEGTVDIVGETPEAPIDVEYMEFTPHHASISGEVTPITGLIPGSMLPEEPVQIPGALGAYDSRRRTLTVADPETVPEFFEGDGDRLPGLSLSTYPFDSFLAHELLHAIQNDVAPDPAPPPNADGGIADRALSEGTADYVMGLYTQQCRSGVRECAPRDFQLRPEIVPIRLVPRRFSYRTGAAFVHAAHERGGWDRVWALNRDPPTSAWAIMFPEQYFDSDVTIERLDSAPSAEGWGTPETRYPGAVGLYFLLRALGVAQVDDPETAVGSAMNDATGIERVYRSDLLSAWRGGRLSVYQHSMDGPTVVRWTTQWADVDAASTLAASLASAYDAAATPDGDGWQLEEGRVAVERSETELRLYSGPTADAIKEIRSA